MFKVIWLKARVFGYVLVCWNVALLLHGSLALAQVTKLTEKAAFSNTLVLHFEDLQRTSNASDVFTNLGVTFAGEGGGTPTVEQILLFDSTTPFRGEWVLRNEPGASSANRALIVRFERPLRRVGLTLGNGSANTLAEIQAFTAKGEFLGKIQQAGIARLIGPFVGLETSHPSGISSVVLDYGMEQVAEQISDVWMEFLSPRNFKVYLPQIVHGGTGNLSFQTVIQIQSLLRGENPRTENEVRLRFFDQAGAPLRMTLDGTEGSEFQFRFGSFGSRQLQTAGSSQRVVIGYASIESSLPMIAHAIFRVFRSDGSLQSETGTPSGEGRIIHVAKVERDPQIALDTAFAIVNVGNVEAHLEFRLEDEAGQPPRDGSQERFVLRPGEHRAFFFSELFNFFNDKKFRGHLAIWSNEPAVVVALRTFGGLPSSSLAIGSTQR
ncbi:MAG: hypothetical protein ACR2L2_03825 [Acidobacteriota bacterium]